MSTEHLKEILESSSRKVTEQLLKDRYLPLLFDPDPMVFNKAWIDEVAGCPHARVYIVNYADEVLGSVPPLRLAPISQIDSKVPAALNLIQRHMSQNSAHGQALLLATLPQIISLETQIGAENQNEWKELLIKYGYQQFILDGPLLEQQSNYTMVDSDEGW